MNLRITRAHARNSDPATSHEAADSVTDKIRASQEAVRLVLDRFPQGLTDTDLIEEYGKLSALGWVPRQSPSGLRTRRSELVRRGTVVDSGNRALLPTGRRAVVWVMAK